MSYQHLTQPQRYQIASMDKAGVPSRAIAQVVACHHSTVSRELKRNRGQDGYQPKAAQCAAIRRRHAASTRPRIDAATWTLIEQHLRQEWSPEQIVGRGAARVSIERIYQYIATDRKRGGDLWRFRRSRRRRRRIGTPRERQRFGGMRIRERSVAVEQRKQVGHWEADSVLGKGPVRIITLVERKSRFTRLRRVDDGKACSARNAITTVLHSLGRCVSSITYDNGSEFAEHALTDLMLECKAYFADPHSPWQRGTNENTNGLIRQYLPKGKSMQTLTHEQLQVIEDKLNNRPRKTLGFKTPSEIFFPSFNRRTS